jgi:DeoR/GlpR family transcriptional regulator of sugar metabolism
VVCTGGTLSPVSLSFVGPLSERMLADYRVNHLFFSCAGIDLEHGLSDVNEAQASLKQQMIRIADHRYLLADHSKFGVKALKRFGALADLDSIITDDGTESTTVHDLFAMGIKVVTA